jgi:hypothetical protein
VTPTHDPLPVARDYSAFDRAVAAVPRRPPGTIAHGGPAPARRVLAYMLDPLILALAWAVLVALLEVAIGSSAHAVWDLVDSAGLPAAAVHGTLIVVMFAVVLLPLVTLNAWEAWTGNTPAKRLLGLFVLGTDDSRAPRGRIVLRWATKSAWFLLLLLAFCLDAVGFPGVEWVTVLSFCASVVFFIGSVPGVVGYVTLHDLVAGTKLVKRA